MAKEHHPNFIYVYSDVFKQEYAVGKKTGNVTFADGVKYSRKEIEIMAAVGMGLSPAEHEVKKIIGGEIVSCERAGTGDKGKPVESGGAKDTGNAGNTGGEVAGASKDGEGAGGGELDIY
jgi:hypothetical protein